MSAPTSYNFYRRSHYLYILRTPCHVPYKLTNLFFFYSKIACFKRILTQKLMATVTFTTPAPDPKKKNVLNQAILGCFHLEIIKRLN